MTTPFRTRRTLLAAALAAGLLLLMGVSLVSQAPPVSITVPYSTTPVADGDLDGDPATGAWSDAMSTTIPLENAEANSYGSATLLAKHDGANMFFRVDGAIDVPWANANANHFWLGFQASSTGTSHHGAGTWDGTFFGLWDGTDYAPQPTYPPPAVDTNGYARPPVKDVTQNLVGSMRYSGAAAPYSFTAEWKRPLNSGDGSDLAYPADGVTTFNFFVTTDSDGGGSNGGAIRHKQVTNLNTLKFAPPSSPNTPPTVDLTAPDGGEDWTGGTVHAIWWNMSDAETAVTALRVWLNYSLDNGASYAPIPGAQGITGLTCPCSYAWTTPLADATIVRVRATVVDGGGISASDASVAPFTLDSTRPTVTGTVPLNGATGVLPTTTVQVAFSEPMNRPTAEQGSSLRRTDTGAYIVGAFSWAGNTLVFTPAGALAQYVPFMGQVNATARDSSAPGNPMTGPVTISFTTADVVPPSIAPAAAPPVQESGGPVNITATVTDNVAVAGVWTEVTDPVGTPLGNFTMGWDGGSGRYYHAAVYRTTGPYGYRVVARDTAGNWAQATGSFAIQDTTPPGITHTPPAGATVGVPIPLQASVTDNDAVAAVRVNYTDVLGATTNATMTPSGPVYTYSIPGQPATGTVTYFVWAVDRTGNAARTVTYTVPVFASDVTPPAISAVAANPPVQDVPGPTNVSATVTDNVAVASVSIEVTDPLGTNLGNMSMARVPTTDTYYDERAYATLGTYTFTLWALDSIGNAARATGTFVVTDRIRPTVASTSASPDPQQVGLAVDFTAQVADNDRVDWVSIGITDPVGTPLGNFTMALVGPDYTYSSAFTALGVHTYVVWAADPSGNVASSSGQFTIRDVDRIPPAISAVAANPPVQDVPGPTNVSAMVTDNVGVASVSIEVTDPFGGSLGNVSMARQGTTYSLERVYAALGTYPFTIWAIDTSGNGASATGSFTVEDRSPPLIAAASASPDPQETGQTVAFTAQVTDNDRVDTVTVSVVNPSGGPLGNFTMALVGPDYTYAAPFTALGVHGFTVWATDPTGHATSASGTFTIRDTTPPTVSATGAGTYRVGTTVAFDASGSTDNSGIANISWSFVYNGSGVSLWGPVVAFRFATVGTYEVTVTVTDLANLQASAILQVVIFTDQTSLPIPSIKAVSPTAPGCLEVTWLPLADANVTTYRLYRWNGTIAAFAVVTEVASPSTVYEDCGLEYDRVYTYRMTAMDASTAESAPSPMVNGRTTAPATEPVDLMPYLVAVGILSITAPALAVAWFLGRRKRRRQDDLGRGPPPA